VYARVSALHGYTHFPKLSDLNHPSAFHHHIDHIVSFFHTRPSDGTRPPDIQKSNCSPNSNHFTRPFFCNAFLSPVPTYDSGGSKGLLSRPSTMEENSHRRTRIVAVVAATIVSLACGTNYAYSAWGPQFSEKLQLSATQENAIVRSQSRNSQEASLTLRREQQGTLACMPRVCRSDTLSTIEDRTLARPWAPFSWPAGTGR
jgi:hypothetical protein